MGYKTQNHKTEVHKMSCMIMNPEPLAAIANATETLLNCGYEYFGFGATHQMHEAFQDCQTCGFYEEIGRAHV